MVFVSVVFRAFRRLVASFVEVQKKSLNHRRAVAVRENTRSEVP